MKSFLKRIRQSIHFRNRQKAGTAQGTFYLYFSSKNALISAIAENLLDTTLDRIKGKTDGSEDFWTLLDILVDETFHITRLHKDIIVLCYSGLAIDHSMEKWEAIYQPYYSWLEGVINTAIEQGEVHSGIHVRWTARTIINVVENAAERFYIGCEQDVDLEVYKKKYSAFSKEACRNDWRRPIIFDRRKMTDIHS